MRRYHDGDVDNGFGGHAAYFFNGQTSIVKYVFKFSDTTWKSPRMAIKQETSAIHLVATIPTPENEVRCVLFSFYNS